MTKIVSEEIESGTLLLAAIWAVAAGVAVLVGLLSESSALQRAAATKVAPTVLVLQIAIPVALAPIVGGESWSGTPLGGAVLIGALVLLSVGVLLLAGSKAVADVLAEPPAEDLTDTAPAPG